MQAENQAVEDFFEKHNMSTAREAEVHQQPQIRIGSVYEKFSALHYNDWQSLFALTEEKVTELIPDSTLRKKFHLLIGNLSRNDSR